ncbi:hypothetical protein ACHHYP_09117 [Achlya hypogyna]|uniref:Uncharacterized protein n=1 Tax=Achlya hypogyna TaxID=1202772 RepID=A0A1V9YNN2_ACHHY|nr:hypothetical protein ACHHYP_09117 [Achlya hypogyna]
MRRAGTSWRRGNSVTPPHGERRSSTTDMREKLSARSPAVAPPVEQTWRAYEPNVDPFSRLHRDPTAHLHIKESATQTEDTECLGHYGSIDAMSMETIDHLIHLLTKREESLTQGEEVAPAAPKRSRSYEALVQMEAILEARHQQLMKHGTLEAYERTTTTSRPAMTDIQDEIARMHTQLLPHN